MKPEDAKRLEEIKTRARLMLETRLSVEPHGEGHAMYLDRTERTHGWNLAHLTELDEPSFRSAWDGLIDAAKDRAFLLRVIEERGKEVEAARVVATSRHCAGSSNPDLCRLMERCEHCIAMSKLRVLLGMRP